LTSCLREAIGSSASVSRPVVKADIRIAGFDESVVKDEVIAVLTELGECLVSDVRIGFFRPMRNGLNDLGPVSPLHGVENWEEREN